MRFRGQIIFIQSQHLFICCKVSDAWMASVSWMALHEMENELTLSFNSRISVYNNEAGTHNWVNSLQKYIRMELNWFFRVLWTTAELKRGLTYQNASIAVLLLLTILVGLATYQKRSAYHHVDENLTRLHPRLATLQRLRDELCPEEESDQLCGATCWNGAPYKEPNFLLSPNCSQHSKTELLIYVYTRPSNYLERADLRQSFLDLYLSDRGISKFSASLLFIVGVPQNETGRPEGQSSEQSFLNKEHSQYGDILQIDVKDTYTNLGFKGLGAFKFIMQCGPSIKHIVKLDDDPTDPIDMKTVFETVDKIVDHKNTTHNRIVCLHVLYGIVAHEPKLKDKWEASFDQYFSRHFPPYCFGNSGIFMNRQVAESLYKAARERRVFHIDDVYITGLLRQRACVPFADWNNFYNICDQILYQLYQYLSRTHSYEFVSIDINRQELRTKHDSL